MDLEVKRKVELDGIRNALLNTIPDGMTNGDVIKVLFPNGYISVGNRNIYYNFNNVKIQCHKDWWNAPFMKGENE